MSPEDSARRLLQALVSDAEADLLAMDRQHERVIETTAGAASAWPGPARAAVLAVALHAYYSATKSLLVRVARVVDGGQPRGDNWHRELLVRMARPLRRIRPAVLSDSSHAALVKLLGFRHFFRHAYAVELDLATLSGHAERLLVAHATLATDCRRFLTHLEAMAESLPP